jgi:hypothetical protein
MTMATHPTEQALLAMLEGAAALDVRAHVEACGECRRRVDEAAEALVWAREAGDVPPPAPFFWESFRRQVAGRIEADTAGQGWRIWLRRPWLVPVLAGACALIVAVPLARVPGSSRGLEGSVLPAWTALPAASEDSGLVVLAGALEMTPDPVAVADCTGVEECVAGLSDEESQDLTEALRASWPEQRS